MRLRTRSITIAFARGITQVSAIVLGMVLVRLISKGTYGTYRQVFLLTSLVEGVFLANVGASLFYFLPRDADGKNRGALLAHSLVISLTVAIVGGGGIWLFAPAIAGWFKGNELLIPALRAFAPYVIVRSILALVPSFMIALDHAIRGAVYSVASALVRIGTAILLFSMGLPVAKVLLGMLLAEGALAIVPLVDMLRKCPPGSWGIDLSGVWAQLSYIWPLWLTSGIALLGMRLDQLLISSHFSSADFAVYAVGAYELPVTGLVVTSVNTAIMPNLVMLMDEDRRAEALALWQNGARKAALVIFPCFVFFLFHARDLMVLLYGQAFHMAAWPFAIYLLQAPFRVTMYGSLLKAVGKNTVISIASAAAVATNLGVGLALIRLGGGGLLSFVGPAIGALGGAIVLVLCMVWMLCRFLRLSVLKVLPLWALGQVMIPAWIAALTFLVPLPEMPGVVKLLLHFGMYSLAFLVVIARLKLLSHDEIKMMGPVGRLLSRTAG